ncbi:29317_t:CDS:2, partial [Gigaspora margarita]
ILTMGRTFKTMQSINEPVTVEDHNFSKKSKIKLIPSVYLLIDSNDSNTMLCSGQLTIFIRPEYFALDLDYLTICTYVPYQSAYSPMKRSMASLSEKFASITLPIDEYSMLCKLWSRDDIYSKPVTVYYVDQISQLFDDIDDIVIPI